MGKKREDYIFASTRVRQLEKGLLPMTVFQRLADEHSFRDAMKLFSDSSYGVWLNQSNGSSVDYEFALKSERDRIYQSLQELIPDDAVNELLALPYIYHDLKVLLKEQILSADFTAMLVEAGGLNFNYLRNILEYPERNPQKEQIEIDLAKAQSDYASHGDPQRIDLLLDKAMLQAMVKAAEEAKVDLLTDYTRLHIDFTNLATLLRLRRQGKQSTFVQEVLSEGGTVSVDELINVYAAAVDSEFLKRLQATKLPETLFRAVDEYFKTGDLAVFEKAGDEVKNQLALSGSAISYGPEVIFAYALRKEAEIKNLRIILSAAKMNIPRERTVARLRRLDG